MPNVNTVCCTHAENRVLNGRMMNVRTICTVVLFTSLIRTSLASGEEKPTTPSYARAAIEANLRTPEGKAYDEQLGKEFLQKHLTTMRQCKQTAGKDVGSFWILLKLNKDGTVKELLLHPETKLSVCARETLFKSRFPPPPRPAYWVGVYMKISH